MSTDIYDLEDDLEKVFEHYHVRAQMVRFATAFILVLAPQLITAGIHAWTWAALWSLLAGAAVLSTLHEHPSSPQAP